MTSPTLRREMSTPFSNCESLRVSRIRIL
jgi:hypothetical protein